MSGTHTDRLRNINTFPQLVKYLREELDWEIESDDFEEITFDYQAEELGLDTKAAAKVKYIKRLRPVYSNQPWSIFFVNFEPKRLPLVVLRRILNALVVRKRASANKAERPAWQMGDLLFISSYGDAEHRDISFAHFVEAEEQGDLPTLKVLGWDDEDTTLRLRDVQSRLHEYMRWPDDPKDAKAWRKRWAEAFVLKHREVIRTSKDLAEQMARLAQRIRKRALNVLEVESDKGPLRKMMEAFKEALIHDLDDDGFADMYAQTITYGLLTARVSREAGLVADNVVDMVPVTNPFLKDMLQMFLNVGGRKAKIDFDELGINEVVHALRKANMEQVLRDFGDRNPQEDPVIHFYELFLKEYDAKKRMQRGVFYTPRPVVSYIVRSVHELLQTEFGLEDGLADTTTWGEMAKRHKGLKIPEGVDPKSPFVNILDPATGTATFLVEVIDLIHKTMDAKWKKEGLGPIERKAAWNEYVPKHLLPRVHGYELLMAPYAVAHMKIGLKLWETGYRFKSDERARIYLTNALEPGTDKATERSLDDWAPALAHESAAVNEVKRKARFVVVMGNPPYASYSLNRGLFASELVEPFKKGLNERKINLDDDYLKFLAFGQQCVLRANAGVLGVITNNTYIDGLTLRGLRRALLGTFQGINIVDLHGSIAKRQSAHDGSPDENVFDIEQGVCIALMARIATSGVASTTYADVRGSRNAKYELLGQANHPTSVAVKPAAPMYFFVRKDMSLAEEWSQWTSISDAMSHKSGFMTQRDDFVTDDSSQALEARVRSYFESTLSGPDLATHFKIHDYRNFSVDLYRRTHKFDPRRIHRCLFRPFDARFVYYEPTIVQQSSEDILRHMLKPNIGLVFMRQVVQDSGGYNHFLVTRLLLDHRCMRSNRGYANIAPLYLYGDSEGFLSDSAPTLNLSKSVHDAFCRSVGQDAQPEQLLAYIYATFWSETYRTRYAEYLGFDFPRLPLTENHTLFRALVALGGELTALHLLESPKLAKPITEFIGRRSAEIEKVSYADQTVWIDKKQTTGFKGVPEDVWNFHIGGYQVCHKWLKDRKGRTLSQDDISHYHKIVVALSETIRLMAEIDQVINQHGGWPAAFAAKPTS